MTRRFAAFTSRSGIVALLAATVLAQCAEAAFTPHSAEYKVRISVVGGRLNTQLIETEDGYAAHHVVKPTGVARMITRGTIDEYSEFQITEDGVRPDTYRSHDRITSDKVKADFTFDWDALQAVGIVNGEDIVFDMGELAHDRVSIQYQLMHDLLEDDETDTYTLFDIDEMKTLNITRIGEKQVEVGAGEFTAIGVQHQRVGSSRVTTMWCVEELDYLPVIVEQHRKGKLRMRATLDRYTPIN